MPNRELADALVSAALGRIASIGSFVIGLAGLTTFLRRSEIDSRDRLCGQRGRGIRRHRVNAKALLGPGGWRKHQCPDQQQRGGRWHQYVTNQAEHGSLLHFALVEIPETHAASRVPGALGRW